MFIIYVIDLSTENKMNGGSYFYENQKYRPLEIEKKKFCFSYFISEIANFSYFPENAQFSSEYCFKFTENFQEEISNGVPYQKFTDLQTAAFSFACF